MQRITKAIDVDGSMSQPRPLHPFYADGIHGIREEEMEMDDTGDVVLIAEATARPGKRDELLRSLLDDLIPKALVEPEVYVFRLHEDRDQAGHFMLYAWFHDGGSTESRLATEYSAAISRVLAEVAEGGHAMITCYEVLTE
ncbi:putative quinol monooxygenase [Mycobacterium sp. 852002-30065_SCH5024008]|uniref:putative quinol monooxygenase n=1 Tax=Mycobacterium sp. 852002-30065_SCH5024008 TaxID=1834088 RepID=UPI000A80BE72|nr:antibiotic biosynthesis monooxygenase [Mycobacterium sp. 852002-30065_SCH5024008]